MAHKTKIIKMKKLLDVTYLEGALHYSYKQWQGTKSKRDWNVYTQFSLVATGLGLTGTHIWKAATGKLGVWDNKQIQEFSMVISQGYQYNQPTPWSAFYKPSQL